MENYGISDLIEVAKSSIHGDGIFAKADIKQGTTVEVCRLLRLGWRMAYQQDPIIRDYCWGNLGCPCEQCKMHGPHAFIALGYGSLYNHADSANIETRFDYDKLKLTLVAKKDIGKGEELFVSYGENYWKQRERYLTKH